MLREPSHIRLVGSGNLPARAHGSMSYFHLNAAEIERIRAHMRAANCHSYTSRRYQDQVLDLLDKNSSHPGAIVEIGCYLGGLTTQLAYACKALGKQLYVIDINFSYLARTAAAIDQLGVAGSVSLFHGNLHKFCSVTQIKPAPLLFVVDGDHRYDGVVSDLWNILGSYPEARHAVFHDFSLRYDKPGYQNVRVDRALLDTLGGSFPIQPFGQMVSPNSGFHLSPSPRDGHYHEEGQPEAALIDVRAAALTAMAAGRSAQSAVG